VSYKLKLHNTTSQGSSTSQRPKSDKRAGRTCFSGLVGNSTLLSILCLSALANILAVLRRGVERFSQALVICAGRAVLPAVELPAGCSQLVDRSDGAIVPTRKCRRTQAGQEVLATAAPSLEQYLASGRGKDWARVRLSVGNMLHRALPASNE